MRLLFDDPNPANVLKTREYNYCPNTWTSIVLGVRDSWSLRSDVDEIRSWIFNNLSGNFCIVNDVKIVDNKMEVVTKIGFEEASESTMFSLGCSVLHDRGITII
jgi:hypothetical protein